VATVLSGIVRRGAAEPARSSRDMEGRGSGDLPRLPRPASGGESWPIWRIGYLTLTLAVDWQPAAPTLQPPPGQEGPSTRPAGDHGGDGASGQTRGHRPSPYDPAARGPQQPSHPPPGWPARLHTSPRGPVQVSASGGQVHLGTLAPPTPDQIPCGVPQTPVESQTPRTPAQLPEWLRQALERERAAAGSASGSQQAADEPAPEHAREQEEEELSVGQPEGAGRRRHGRPSGRK
jgi:hypothetical protein